MLTREYFPHAYTSRKPRKLTSTGTVKVKDVRGITQTWAISRPGNSPECSYSGPLMLSPTTVNPPREHSMWRGGFGTLLLPTNRVEMDPSDVSTWQRSYRFTS